MIGFFYLKGLLIFLIINIIFLPSGYSNIKNYNPVASIVNLEGIVKIQTKESQKFKYARDGMLLFNGNKIITSINSKTGILYRDGSKVRIFQNSELILNLSEENFNKKRNFKYLLTFKKGSLRGRFMKDLQNTNIRTPSAIIGIKGTTFRVSEKNNDSTVSLTEGKLEVKNLSSSITIETGQWLNGFGPNTNLAKKVSFLPNILALKTNFYEIDFKEGDSKQIELSIQIQNRISEKIIKRSGSLALESDYKKINLPRKILLDERGFAKILIQIDPPSLNEPKFFGLIKIRAFVDDEGFDEVAEGLLVLKIKNYRKKRTILIHPDRGIFEKKY